MSRSYKKIPAYGKNDQDFKRLSNKKARKYDIDSGCAYKKLGYTYDICDYKGAILTDDDARLTASIGGLHLLRKGYIK